MLAKARAEASGLSAPVQPVSAMEGAMKTLLLALGALLSASAAAKRAGRRKGKRRTVAAIQRIFPLDRFVRFVTLPLNPSGLFSVPAPLFTLPGVQRGFFL